MKKILALSFTTLIMALTAIIGVDIILANTEEMPDLHGGRLHNVFDGDLVNRPAHGWRNWNVFAENFGETPILVRVQLQEYLAFDEMPIDEGLSIDDPIGSNGNQAWPAFVSSVNNVNQRRYDTLLGSMDAFGIQWRLGHQDHEPLYYMPTHNRMLGQIGQTAFNPLWVITNYGGRIRDHFSLSLAEVPDLFVSDDAHRMAEVSGYAVDSVASHVRYESANFDHVTHASDFLELGTQTASWSHQFEAGGGWRSFWTEGDTHTAPLIYGHSEFVVNAGDRTHYAQRTLMPSIEGVSHEDLEIELGHGIDHFTGVMTIANWENLGRPAGNFWIHDTETGWFYWNGMLLPGENPASGTTNATSLLVEEMYVPQSSQSVEYVTAATSEFITCHDVGLMEQQGWNLDLFGDIDFDEFLNCGDEPIDTTPVVCPFFEWDPFATYDMGDYVIYDGLVWRANQFFSGDGSLNWRPINTVSLWELADLEIPVGCETIIFADEWDPNNARYIGGDYVIFNGYVYRAYRFHESMAHHTPDLVGSLWRRTSIDPDTVRPRSETPLPGGVPLWETNVTYHVGDRVIFNYRLWEALGTTNAADMWHSPGNPTLNHWRWIRYPEQ